MLATDRHRLARGDPRNYVFCFDSSQAWMPTELVRGLKAHGSSQVKPGQNEIREAISFPLRPKIFPDCSALDRGENESDRD